MPQISPVGTLRLASGILEEPEADFADHPIIRDTMSRTLVLNYIHVIFATKYRQPVLAAEWRPELFTTIGRISNSYDCKSIAVGGYSEHVHVLANLSKKMSVVEYLKQLKMTSSQWITAHKTKPTTFHWQAGYAVFSVSHSLVETVESYILNQESRHSKQTFVEELDYYAEKHGVRWEYEDENEIDDE